MSNIARKAQAGFTLIELMIVVAIIGILAAIAIPAYQDYTIRSQVSEGLTLAAAAKAAVAEFYANNGGWPADSTEAGVGALQGKYTGAVSITGGGITITYGNEANTQLVGQTLALTPGASPNGDVVWKCGDQADPAAWGSGPAATQGATSLASKYLPGSCR
jgi:type IV pilus assembly protein PilA